jgi:MoxR-like ATPase
MDTQNLGSWTLADMRQFMQHANIVHLYSAARGAGLKFKSGDFNKNGLIEKLLSSPSIARATIAGVVRMQQGDHRRGVGGYLPPDRPAEGSNPLADDLSEDAGTMVAGDTPAPPTAPSSEDLTSLERRMAIEEQRSGEFSRNISALIAGSNAHEKRIQSTESAIAELQKRTPVVFTIGDAVSSLPVQGEHYLFPQMVEWLELKNHVLLIGPASSGKSSAARAFAKLKGLTLYSQPQVVDSFGILGFVGPQGVIETPFSKAWTQGGVFLIDEISMNGSDALGALNDALAGGYAPLPNQGYVKAHPDFYCIAGDNSDTGANAKYSARNVLDGATMDRFITIDWPIDPEIEKLCAGKHLDWLAAVRSIRAFIETNDIQHVGATVRAVIFGREALDRTSKPRMAILEQTCRKGLLRDNWAQVLALPEVRVFLQGGK